MPEFTVIGRSTPLIDGRAKVTGATRYAPDLQLPGMLHARFVSSIYAHANLRGINTLAALAVPGVVAVLTADDLPAIVPKSRSRLLLARDRVIFAGQPVALVLADSEAAAEDAAEKVHVEYEPLPAATTIEAALADDAPLVWPRGVPTGSEDAGAHGADVSAEDVHEKAATNIASQSPWTRGDIKAGFAQADMVIERTFTTPMVHQASLEPQAVLIQPDPAAGGATVWASTQSAFSVRREVADILGVPESDVRVIGMPPGGAFGGKIVLYEPLIALVARMMDRPIRLVLTRMEEMLAANPAPPVIVRARIGAKSDGTLTALEAAVYLDSGCYPSGLSGFIGYMMASFYRIPNYHIDTTEVLTFKQSVGAYRAPGGPTTVFVLDSLIDEMAVYLQIDPFEIRLKNISRPGDPLPNNKPWPGMGAVEVLEALREHPAWQNREAARAAGRGVGIAIGGWMGGLEPAAAACSLNRDGLLHIHVGSMDLTGTTTGFALLAAEAFGIAPENVRIITGDTDHAPYSGVSGGSKVTYTTGAAVVTAAEEARQQVLTIAAEEFEAAPEDLEIVDGQVQVRGVPGKTIQLKDIATKTMQFGGKYAPVFGRGRNALTQQSPGFNAQLVEVEVDQETGVVCIHRLVAAQDVGRAINPLTIKGQMMGGATQGIGWALYEKMDYDANGQMLTGSFMDYAVPAFTHAAGEIETILVEVPSATGPFGARGVGEPPVMPTAAAIANAIADVTGVRLTDLPMTAPYIVARLASRD